MHPSRIADINSESTVPHLHRDGYDILVRDVCRQETIVS